MEPTAGDERQYVYGRPVADEPVCGGDQPAADLGHSLAGICDRGDGIRPGDGAGAQGLSGPGAGDSDDGRGRDGLGAGHRDEPVGLFQQRWSAPGLQLPEGFGDQPEQQRAHSRDWIKKK